MGAPVTDFKVLREGGGTKARIFEDSWRLVEVAEMAGILRQAKEPLTTRDIVMALMTERALNTNDHDLVRLMTKRKAVSLRGYCEQGYVRSSDGPGPHNLWELVR